MRKLPVILIGLCLSLTIDAQTNCNKASDLWKDYERYIPTEESPVFTIRVNYIIPQKSDGSGNFRADDPETMALLEKSIKTSNKLWANLKPPKDNDCYEGDDFLPDTYIRFVLNAVIFHKSDYYWNADNGSMCPNDGNWYLNTLDAEIRSNPDYANAINVYLPNYPEPYEDMVVNGNGGAEPKSKAPCSELPDYKDLARSSRINLSGSFNKYYWMKNVYPYSKEENKNGNVWDPTVRGWLQHSFAHTMVHELGHSMGLRHGNEHHARNQCDESIMHQGHGQPHNYLQPTELGKIHRNLRLSNLRAFVTEDMYAKVPMVIVEDMSFDMDYWSYEDIIVEPGVTLTIDCNMSLHERAKVIVRPGGRLIINATLSSRSDKTDNIVIELQKERWRLFSKTSRKKGSLEMGPSGRLSHAKRIRKVRRQK